MESELVPADSTENGSANNGGRPSARRKAEADARAVKAYHLRIHDGLSWAQIGDKLGLTPMGAKGCYERGRAYLVPKEEIQESKELALAKLDRWEEMTLAIFNARHHMISFGRLVEGTEDFTPKRQAIDTLLKIERMRCDIIGYRAPSKRVLEVVSEDAFDKAIHELNEQAAKLERETARAAEEEALDILKND